MRPLFVFPSGHQSAVPSSMTREPRDLEEMSGDKPVGADTMMSIWSSAVSDDSAVPLLADRKRGEAEH